MALTQVETSGLSGSGASSNSTTGNVFSQTGPFKNRIINGDMRIDQRNAGASVTPTVQGYTLDRWRAALSQSSKYSVQQSSTSATGFPNSLLATSLSAYTVGAAEWFGLQQSIEGFNASDLAWGTANAKTVTLSFWVRSSLTGTFGGSLANNDASRSYPFSYTISSANTFEYKTVTISGDTSGTWLTTNGIGIRVTFGLGVGSNFSTTASAWAGGEYYSATGATSVVGTNGATFYITGVQLEVGTSATQFERRSYGQELALCQRYYQQIGKTSSSNDVFAIGYTTSSNFYGSGFLKVSMRAAPTFSYNGTLSDLNYTHPGVSAAVSSIVASQTNPDTYTVQLSSATGTTNGFGAIARAVTANVAVTLTAEL